MIASAALQAAPFASARGKARSQAPARIAGASVASLRTVARSRRVAGPGIRAPLVTFATAGDVIGGEVRPDYDTYFPKPAPQRRAGVLLHPTSLPVSLASACCEWIACESCIALRYPCCLGPLSAATWRIVKPHGVMTWVDACRGGAGGWGSGTELSRPFRRARSALATSGPRRTHSWIGSKPLASRFAAQPIPAEATPA